MSGVLYLFPADLGDIALNNILPAYNLNLISSVTHFIVEDVRTARRFLKKCDSTINIDALTFYVLNEHTPEVEIASFIEPLKSGVSMGLLSEAGCPAVADPGASVVQIAQQLKIPVRPLVGPNSIILALMGSGFNGQSFAFNGYLPVQSAEKQKVIRRLEQRVYQDHQTQLFIETPYRNMKTLDDFIAACRPESRLCIAADLTLESEYIVTRSIREWQKNKPELHKRPAIFVLYK